MLRLALGLVLAPAGCFAVDAQLLCQAVAEPLEIMSEGLTERLGAIVIECGALSGDTVTNGSLNFSVSSPVTNRLVDETLPDIVMTADTSTGRIPVGGSPRLVGGNLVLFQTFTFALPANGRTTFQIAGIRVAAPSTQNTGVSVLISTPPSSIGIGNSTVTAGVTRRGFFASSSTAQIVCTGSPLPPEDEIRFSTLLGAGTRFFTFRVAEGSLSAFKPREPGTGHGLRVLIRYSGFPPGARLFVPNVISGANTSGPTSAGDMGLAPFGGGYITSFGGLLLSRAVGATMTGSGGTPTFTPVGPGPFQFDGVSEVPLLRGEGTATWEVMASDPFRLENAQIPTFIGLPPPADGVNTIASARITLAPISTVRTASESAPIPRYAEIAPEIDCGVVGDCNAGYFPRLFVDAPALEYRVPARTAGFWSKFIRVLNESGGVMSWSTRIDYTNGSGWLVSQPASGVGNASINLHARPENLAPGFYEATFTVDAGPIAGSRGFRVRLEVFTPPAPVPVPPSVTEFGNAANMRVDRLVPGSLATLKGSRLGGRVVTVTFDSIPATVIFSSDTQINLLVPAQLAGRPVAHMQVTADGVANVGQVIQLAVTAPAIFSTGILNQDGFPNTAQNPELVGRYFQVFATGLPQPGTGRITAKVHDREIDVPAYGGPAPGLDGVQQVNFPIPDDLPAMRTEVLVCGIADNDPGRKVCSPPVEAYLRRID